MIAEAVGYLGPANVLGAPGKPGYVRVDLPGAGPVWARLAMAIPYRPDTGDEVLVICNDPAEVYVIGVLTGRGITTLSVPADLRLEAAAGRIQLVSGRAIELRSSEAIDLSAPRAAFRFARLEMLVATLVQRVTDAYTWATGLVQTRSRRSRWIADEGWFVRAGRAHVRTTDNIHIKGKTIHLG